MVRVSDSLVFSIYLAALESARWSDVVRDMKSAANVSCLSLIAVDRLRREPLVAESGDAPMDLARSVREHCLAHLASNRVPRNGLWRHNCSGTTELGDGRRYFRGGLLIGSDAGIRISLCLLQEETRGPVPDGALEMAASIAPHILSALSLQDRREENERMERVVPVLPDPARATPRRIDRLLLTQRYGLTDRELAVCEHFLNLASVEETACALGVEVSTVRFHLKGIYSKTDVRSLPALMRLLVESQRSGGPDKN